MSPLLRRTKKEEDAGRPEVPPAGRTVTLLSKPGCHLCDDARAVVAAVCSETGTPWQERDITQDAELQEEYWEQIPVVLVDGEQHTFWRVDAERLRKALAG
jgi:glutaredoxin